MKNVLILFADGSEELEAVTVVNLLRRGGIEYALRREPVQGLGPMQVHVAEEDVPRAEELLLREQR